MGPIILYNATLLLININSIYYKPRPENRNMAQLIDQSEKLQEPRNQIRRNFLDTEEGMARKFSIKSFKADKCSLYNEYD